MDNLNHITFELETTLHLIKRKTAKIFKENNFPVSKDQWLILNRIAQHEGSHQRDIAKDTLKDPAALTRMLDILVAKAYVQRKASKTDRRTFDVFLTVEGNRLVNRIKPQLEEFNDLIENSLTRDESISFRKLIGKINSKLER